MSGRLATSVLQPLSPRARWWLLLAILSCPLLLTVLAAVCNCHPVVPRDSNELLRYVSFQTLLWGAIFVVGFRISGVSVEQLRLVTRNPLRTLAFGVLWFVVIYLLEYSVDWMLRHWLAPSLFWDYEEKSAADFDHRNLAHHLNVSIAASVFIVLTAGTTEELWRAGMVAGIKALFPGINRFTIILFVAVLFALGHVYQGFWGAAYALIPGIALGSILVYRHSYWEAAIAHVLFDAVAFSLGIMAMLHVQTFDQQLAYAASKGDRSEVRHWIAVAGNVNASFDAGKDWKNITVLENAAGRPDTEMVRFLLEQGADPNLADSHGRTPLIAAAEQNHLPIVVLLLARGAKTDVQDRRGFTALRSAAEYNRMEIAQALIDHGADLNIPDHDGISPLAAAKKWGYDDMKNLLQQNGAK